MNPLRFLWLFCGFILAFGAFLSASTTFNYSYMPKKVYENQLFSLTVASTGQDSSNKPDFTFDTSRKMQPLFKNPLVVRNGNDVFYTFYFKASTTNIRIPRLFIFSDSGDLSLDSQHIFIEKLKAPVDFSKVLAADMKIINSQVSNYDENNIIITLSIEAYEANLEDMRIQGLEESGIELLTRKNAKVTSEFFVVLPVEKKSLNFSYFNTIKRQFISFSLPTVVADASVTTQSDLNPKEDDFAKLKKYFFVVLVAFFAIMFLFRRDFFYLVLGVISLITLLTFYIPHKKICIKQGTALYILPTLTSTISTHMDVQLDTFMLGERENFKKIEYKKGIIGWVKNEDLCKP